MVLQSPVKVQVLVSALNQDSKNLTEQMNIASDAVVVNQCDGYDYREWHTKSGRVQSFGMTAPVRPLKDVTPVVPSSSVTTIS